MSAGLVPFDYSGQEIRTVTKSGEPGFVAADVCAALSIADVRQAAERLDEADRYQAPIRSGSQNRQMWIVTESGLYDLIIRSDKPEARPFRRWITSEVLPSLRKTGKYETESTVALPDLSTATGVLAMAEQFAATARQLVATEQRAELAESTVLRLVPAANAWAAFVDAGHSMEVGAAAKCLAAHGASTGRNRLYSLLRDWRWVFQRTREPMGSAVERGLVRLALDKPHTNPKTGEEQEGNARTRLTAKGLERLADYFGVSLDPAIVGQYIDSEERAA